MEKTCRGLTCRFRFMPRPPLGGRRGSQSIRRRPAHMAPGAPHIALRCPVSKEARGPWRPGLPGPVPFCPPPSRGGVALTLSPPRGIASPPRKIFPIFFPPARVFHTEGAGGRGRQPLRACLAGRGERRGRKCPGGHPLPRHPPCDGAASPGFPGAAPACPCIRFLRSRQADRGPGSPKGVPSVEVTPLYL